MTRDLRMAWNEAEKHDPVKEKELEANLFQSKKVEEALRTDLKQSEARYKQKYEEVLSLRKSVEDKGMEEILMWRARAVEETTKCHSAEIDRIRIQRELDRANEEILALRNREPWTFAQVFGCRHRQRLG